MHYLVHISTKMKKILYPIEIERIMIEVRLEAYKILSFFIHLCKLFYPYKVKCCYVLLYKLPKNIGN